jgi:glycosyltransferase involved in cell wall biosynthesis
MGKLVYIGGFELPDKNAAAQRVTSNAKIFSSLGYDVTLIGVDKELHSTQGLITNNFQHYGFDIKSLSYPKNKLEWLSSISGRKEIFKYLDDNVQDIDCIILYNYPSFASYRIKRKMQACGVKVFSDITEWYSSKGAGLIFSFIKWLDTSLRVRLVARKGDGVITTSPFMTEFYRKRSHEVLELPTLYDVSLFKQPNVVINRPTRFIYVGSPFDVGRAIIDRSAVKERLDIIIDALYILNQKYNFIFDIYGVTKRDYLKVYTEHKKKLEMLKCKVHFFGRVPHSEALKEISNADYSIFFRDNTLVNLAGFPSKMAESISCGIPVITSDIPSLKAYRDFDGIYLAVKGEEVNVIETCLNQSTVQLNELKKVLFESKFFDFNSFISSSNKFINRIKKD